MKEFLVACAKELTSPLTTHIVAASAGAITVAAIHNQMMGNGRTFCLPKQKFDALVTGEEPFALFVSDKHDHMFRVTIEQ